MNALIWFEEDKIEVWCVGHFECERVGYYAGTGVVNNFMVFSGNDNITAELDKSDLKELEEKYLNYCLNEVA